MTNDIILSELAAIETMTQEWDLHLTDLVKSKQMSQRTQQTYQAAIKRFMLWAVENRHLVDQNVAINYKIAMNQYSPYSVNVWITGARTFFDWCVSTGRLANNPFKQLKGYQRKGTNQKHSKQSLTNEEVRRILSIDNSSKIGLRDKAIVALMLYCGLRTIEIHRANYEHLRTEQNQLVLDVHGKGRLAADETVILTNQALVTSIMDWIAARGQWNGALFVSFSDKNINSRLTTDALRHIVKAYFKVSGIIGAKKSTHSLRHTAITNAIYNGASIQKVQSMARHANVSTTMRYFHEVDRLTNPAESYIDYGEEKTDAKPKDS